MNRGEKGEKSITPRSTFILLGIIFFLVLTVGSVIQLYSFLPGIYVTEWLLIFLPTLILLKTKDKDVRSVLKVKNFTMKNLALGILGGLGIFILSSMSAFLAQEILGPYPFTPLAENIPSTWLGFVPWFLGLGVSAGICEEVLFRGFLQEGLSSRWGKLKVVLIAAAIFSVFHLDPWRLAGTFMLGIAAGYLLIETDSILTPITLHVTNNAIALSIAFAFSSL